MSSVNPNDIIQYLDNKKNALFDENDALTELEKTTPQSFVKNFQVEQITDSIVNQLKNSPLAQLGEDFLAEQISKVGNQLLSNAQDLIGDQVSAVKTAAEKAVNLAFSTITAAVTAQNNIILYFLQQLAQQIIDATVEKDEVLVNLQESTRQLYNALVQLVAGDPFFSRYLEQLREALRLLFAAQQDMVRLRNTYVATDVFQSRRYQQILDQLNQAQALLEPQGEQTDRPFTDSGLFAGIGPPSDPQQLTLILSIPKLAKEVILNTKGYFLLTAQINGLLVAFYEGRDVLTSTSSSKLKDYTVGMITSVYSTLDSLTQEMATQINGSPFSYNQPLSSFTPKPIPVSQNSLGWMLQVKGIIAQWELIPKDSLKDMNLNETVNAQYDQAVTELKALGDIVRNNAILRVNEGQEQIGLIETQITQFTLGALGAIGSGSVAQNILPLGRAVISYLDLASINNIAIRNALFPFVNGELPFFNSIKRVGDGIYSLLSDLGLDKAADLLRSGRFADFFNLNAQTATYAGAALGILADLKQCVGQSEQVEILSRAEREIKKDVQANQLFLQRSANSAIRLQREENTNTANDLEKFKTDVKTSSESCIVDENGNFNGDALVERFGTVLGVNLLADSFGTDRLQQLAKGRFF